MAFLELIKHFADEDGEERGKLPILVNTDHIVEVERVLVSNYNTLFKELYKSGEMNDEQFNEAVKKQFKIIGEYSRIYLDDGRREDVRERFYTLETALEGWWKR